MGGVCDIRNLPTGLTKAPYMPTYNDRYFPTFTNEPKGECVAPSTLLHPHAPADKAVFHQTLRCKFPFSITFFVICTITVIRVLIFRICELMLISFQSF